MFAQSKSLGLAVLFIGITGLLNIGAPVVSAFSRESLLLAPVGFLWLLVAVVLSGNRRWFAWISYLAVIIGGIAALFYAMEFSNVPRWLYGLIALGNGLAALSLFVHLWFAKSIKTAPALDPYES